MSLLTFVKSKGFILNIIIALVFVGAVVYGAFYGLKIYTQHSISYTVPDLSGMTLEEVDTLCNSKDLLYEVIDSVHINSVARGCVVEQMPAAGAQVKENRNIYLTVNSILPEMIKMPNLLHYSYREARARLESYGIAIDSLDYRPGFQNLVLDQRYKGNSIKPATLIEKGSKIVLVLGEGESDQKRSVPVLLGHTVQEAKTRMLDLYLNLVVVYDETVSTAEDSAVAQIFKQSPKAEKDSEINLGGSVDVWVTTNKAIVPVVVRDTSKIEGSPNEI